ncbi:MAG TPA: DUF1080 domain-containing protein [Vicinamibacterales bacterium]|nr:DUF1080 domain-containing protein [Vicinamibacterales bacterium]
MSPALWMAAAAAMVAFTLARPAARAAPAGQAPATAGPAAARPRPSPFVPPEPLDYDDHDGWTSIFDGATLTGWDGNPAVWRVEDGAITAESTADHRVGSTHLIWRGGELDDFELKLEIKLDGDIHSGIAYRSTTDLAGWLGPSAPRAGGAAARGPVFQVPADPRWTLYGPGLDFDADLQMAGNVEERGTTRREIAWRGGIVRAAPGVRPRLIGSLGDADALRAFLVPGGWNQIHIIARGRELTHIVNGHVMAILIDDDPTFFRARGDIGLQIEQYGAGRVHFRRIWIKDLDGSGAR